MTNDDPNLILDPNQGVPHFLELDIDSPDDDYQSNNVDNTSPLNPNTGVNQVDLETPSNTTNLEDNDPTDNNEDDLITLMLKSKGIKDPHAIKQVDEQGNEEDVDFYNLPREEQLNILHSSDLDNNYGLSPDETNLVNVLRNNKISVNDYIDYVQRQAVEDYINSNTPDKTYDIDTLSDDELYILDLKSSYEDLTEVEALDYLTHEKGNTSLWEKRIKTLRDNYKAKEDSAKEEQRLLAEKEENESKERFASSMNTAISNLTAIESFDLEDEDREKISEFVLGTDATGTNYMYKALNDPETVAKMAWFAMEGENAIKSLNDYWTGVVKQTSKSNYDQGYKDAQSGSKPKTTTRVSDKRSNKGNKFISIDEVNYIDLD